MLINTIKIHADGYVHCKSGFYCASDIVESQYVFNRGLNKLEGEIDSGIWAMSYLISMYKHRKKDFILDEEDIKISINNKIVSLNEISQYSCYMDEIYPLFSSKRTVGDLVKKALLKSKLDVTSEEIRSLFQMEKFRFERPIRATGHEVFKAMAAIGYCHGKEIYCFPWMSQKRFEAFHFHLSLLIDQLVNLKKVVILPLGY